jgi:chromosome segregation ATPase
MSVFNSLALLRRLRNLEKQMVKFDDQIKSLKTDLDAVKADLATATTGIAGLQQQISTLNTTVANLQTELQTAGLTADQQAALTAAVAEADSLKASADTLAANFPAPAGN